MIFPSCGRSGNYKSIGRCVGNVVVALTVGTVFHATPSQAMVTIDSIVITNTGAANVIGYRVFIAHDGAAHFLSGRGVGNAILPGSLRERLTQDLASAKPLGQLPVAVPCPKPPAFDTSAFIAAGGQQSPDLTCPGSAAGRALKNDIDAISAFLGIGTVMRGQGHELPPQNF